MKVVVQGLLIVIANFLFSYSAFALPSESHAPIEKFITLADIHFDPFAGCKVLTMKSCPLVKALSKAKAEEWETLFEHSQNTTPSTYRADTNYALFKSSLVQLKKVAEAEHPRFVLLLGDFLAHSYREQYILYAHDGSREGYRNFVKKTLQFLTLEIRRAVPESDIYPAVGNNDTYTGDYSVIRNGQFFKETASVWASLIKDTANQENFRHQFPTGGYYAVTVPHSKNQRIIMLNTVAFSIHAQGKDVAQLAQQEMDWLHKQLETAAKQHQSVMLAFHIPIGVDVYRTVQNIMGGIVEFWQPVYSEQFRNDLQEFSDTITAILPAHIHMDTFQVVVFKHPQDIPVSFTPSISPIFGNNPGFKVYSYYPESFRLNNYETYYYPINTYLSKREWQVEYNFNQIYQSRCNHCEVGQGMRALSPLNQFASYFKQYYTVGNNGSPIKERKWAPFYWCDIHALSRLEYQQCIQH